MKKKNIKVEYCTVSSSNYKINFSLLFNKHFNLIKIRYLLYLFGGDTLAYRQKEKASKRIQQTYNFN
jgi:uncharacterized protein YcfL